MQERNIGRYLPKRYNEDTRSSRPTIAFLDNDTVRSSTGIKDKWVWQDWEEPTGDVQRVLCALLMRELVMVVLQGHVYTAGGKLFKQIFGGPIGLALTTLVAEILMRKFDLQFESKVVMMGLGEPPLKERYVDDVNTVRVAISTEEELVRVLSMEGIEVEPAPEVTNNNERTVRLYRCIANKILPKSIVMETDIPENHNDGKLPILDTGMWLENENGLTRIRHTFYKNPRLQHI